MSVFGDLQSWTDEDLRQKVEEYEAAIEEGCDRTTALEEVRAELRRRVGGRLMIAFWEDLRARHRAGALDKSTKFWQLSVPPTKCKGRPGRLMHFTVWPDHGFLLEKVLATAVVGDDYAPGAARVAALSIAGEEQSPGALCRWCGPGDRIDLAVEFLQTCTWDADLYGIVRV